MINHAIAAQPIEGNPDFFQFHTRTKLTTFMYEEGNLQGAEPTSDTYLIFSPVTRLILETPGVTWVKLTPYGALVQKGRLFDWSLIAPLVMEILLLWHHTARELDGLEPETRPLQELQPPEQAFAPRGVGLVTQVIEEEDQ